MPVMLERMAKMKMEGCFDFMAPKEGGSSESDALFVQVTTGYLELTMKARFTGCDSVKEIL